MKINSQRLKSQLQTKVRGENSPKFPESGWEDIRKLSCPLQFTLGNVISNFVTRTVSDGKSAKDLKSISKSSENLFTCGHIQNNVVCAVRASVLYIKCKCLPEMRKDRMYSISMALSSNSQEIMQAECGCPAGRGPHGNI